jgi:hypothetical protein
MALPSDINIESLTYTHADLKWTMFHLDHILDRMPPISSLVGPVPEIRSLGTLTILPTELPLNILEGLSIIDLMRFRHCNGPHTISWITCSTPLSASLRTQ